MARVDDLVNRVLNAGPANLREALRELAELADRRLSPPVSGSVLQLWAMELPLREQGTLLTAVRGCDDEPKLWSATGFSDSPGRRLTAFIRWCFMNPADPREVDVPGAFFQSKPPSPFKPSEFGHLPQHWYAHAMHALEIIAYRHPDATHPGVSGIGIKDVARGLYLQMVFNLHLQPEPMDRMMERLSEDRIEKGNVVS